MKSLSILAFLAFIASASLAQDQTQQQIPPSVQTDTTGGWQVVFSNPHYTFAYIKFFDKPENQVGYAVCASGAGRFLLLKTTNLGNTWDSLPTLVPSSEVTFVTPIVGFCVSADSNLVYKTTDGGMSWKGYNRNLSGIYNIAFSNLDTGIVAPGGDLARTIDGGQTWVTIEPGIKNAGPVNDISWGDQKTCYAVGPTYPDFDVMNHPRTAFCSRTTDAGATWNRIHTSIFTDFYSCFALNKDTLIVGGASGLISRTFDAGATWDSIIIPDKPLFDAISFCNSHHGLISGSPGIFVTNDCGKSWEKQYFPNAPWIHSVQLLNDTLGFAMSDSKIFRTSSGGNFSKVVSHTIDFHVQTFPNPSTGTVTIQYQFPTAQQVGLTFYNLQGALIGSVSPGMQSSGIHQTVFDGSQLANGMYYFRLTTAQDFYAGSFTIQR